MQEENHFSNTPQPAQFSPEPQKHSKKRRTKFAVIFFVALIVAVGVFFFWRGARTLTIINNVKNTHAATNAYPDFSPQKQQDRTNILLLGLRGPGDPNGGLLTDTMLLLSYNKQTGKAALISIPRDLFVSIPGENKKYKINAAYAFGEEHSANGGGLQLSKEVVGYVTGVYIDDAVSVDFNAFQKVIDMVGGVTVTRTTPLIESKQWQFEGIANDPYWHIATNADGSQYWVFEVPAGTHTLNATDTLYYVRSRYTTSDFDRGQRERQVIKAVSQKFVSLGVLGNPVRLSQMLDAFGNSLRTDMSFQEMYTTATTLAPGGWANITQGGLDTTNFLMATTSDDGQYILLPKDGNFDALRAYFQNILNPSNENAAQNAAVKP